MSAEASTGGQSGIPAVTIYTDGGADPNPGAGGWGAVLLHEASGVRQELCGGEPHTTNNRMELTAAIRALEALRVRCRVRLVTDSLYLRKGVTLWLPGWILRGWKRKDGVLQNEDLWRRLSELIAGHEVRWDWVKGHSGERYNELADQLATKAIREQRARLAKPVPAAGGTAASGRFPPPSSPDAEIFLRVAMHGSRGGWAALVRSAGGERLLSGTLPGATSNALDLAAASAALEALPPGASAAVHTGSDYLRNGARQWLAGWKRNGWRTGEGSPVKNRDLWLRLDAALAARPVIWPEVKGQALPELERLGLAARAALDAPPPPAAAPQAPKA